MGIVSEIAKLKGKDLKEVQGVIAMLHLLGLSDDDIESLVEIAKNWKTIASNMNLFSEELGNIKRKIGIDDKDSNESETTSNYRDFVGFGTNAELIIPKGAKKK